MALGLLVSRAAVAPVKRLTEATERVSETGDLSERIDARGQDELSRLAGSFNTMLAALAGSTHALEESVRAQRQLVADASHELRTPLTSIRTNVEVLLSERALPPADRRQLLGDVVEQVGEMTTLIAELIELARGDGLPAEPEEVRLDELVAGAVERARRTRPDIVFATNLEESLVDGVPSSLERAIGNLLDNAAKWSPPGGEVEVTVSGGEVTVRDHGPGIDAGRPAVRLRSLLPLAGRAHAPRLGPRPRDRPPGRRGPRRRRHGGARRRRRHPGHPAPERIGCAPGTGERGRREFLARFEPRLSSPSFDVALLCR